MFWWTLSLMLINLHDHCHSYVQLVVTHQQWSFHWCVLASPNLGPSWIPPSLLWERGFWGAAISLGAPGPSIEMISHGTSMMSVSRTTIDLRVPNFLNGLGILICGFPRCLEKHLGTCTISVSFHNQTTCLSGASQLLVAIARAKPRRCKTSLVFTSPNSSCSHTPCDLHIFNFADFDSPFQLP